MLKFILALTCLAIVTVIVCLYIKYNFKAEQRVSCNLIGRAVPYMRLYYMALSHKDWELPNSRI